MSIQETPCGPDSKWQFIPKTNCKKECGTHGTCDENTGNCICKDGYTGETCNISPKSSNYLFLLFLLLLIPLGFYLYKKQNEK